MKISVAQAGCLRYSSQFPARIAIERDSPTHDFPKLQPNLAFMNITQVAISHVDTLIITVGTRQVGWRCSDGIIRSFGADGGSYPPHINELYQELKIDRGNYQEQSKIYPWSVRDLGKRYYDHCLYWLDKDFSRVELLLDQNIIDSGVKKGLKHIVLWGTDQPETVNCNFRRLDTLWLAKLMKGKIKLVWPTVKVDVHTPQIVANDAQAIRQELEILILPDLLQSFSQDDADKYVLWIQNKGCVPAIAQSVEVCAAALVRQCQVFNVIPGDPPSLFEDQDNFQSACLSLEYQIISMGEQFWPLERERVISAWKRGDFREAQIWLKPHQNRYRSLAQLAGYLALSTNWEISKFLNEKNIENGWLSSNELCSIAGTDRIKLWREQLLYARNNKFAQTWESCFLIYLSLLRDDYTESFMKFAQTLERLLYLQVSNENNQNFEDLINSWCCLNQIKQKSNQQSWHGLLHTIRKRRNDIIHNAEPITINQFRDIWANNGFAVVWKTDSLEMMNYMMSVLKKICESSWQIPEKTLLQSLYEWGLNVLSADSSAS